MLTALALIILGLAMLTVAADRFVVAAARLASAWGVSPILIGALVIGMGTSAPEFIVSVISGGRSFDLAIGNIAGSNIANLSLVLGTAGLVSPVHQLRHLFKREGLLMALAMVLFVALFADGGLGRVDGLILAAAMVAASYFLIVWSRGFTNELDIEEIGGAPVSVPREILLGLATLAVMLAGANWLADGALRLAVQLGVTEGFIGLTVVAIGTSLPELATALAAARRGENDLIVGNLLGSNLFNSLVVGAGVALLRPGTATGDFTLTMVMMVGVAFVAGALSLSDDRLARREAVVLLAGYVGYLVFVAG